MEKISCETQAISYETALVSYETRGGSYETGMVSYEMRNVSYEIGTVSYEMRAVSCEIGTVSSESAIGSPKNHLVSRCGSFLSTIVRAHEKRGMNIYIGMLSQVRPALCSFCVDF